MGWVANVLFMVGVWLLGRKCSVGFLLNCLANCLYMFIGWDKGMYDLAAISLIMMGFNVYGYYEWEK